MDKTKLSFEVDADQIDIKPLLRKDFLELSMRAISSVNPNRNKSWFTKESMENSIDTFKNKPILGYFENDDFVSHNGDWKRDNETQLDYWDTLGKQGERILGLIRSEDEVKIIEDANGISWVCLTCALWVQYGFKQVKRLLKDAKKAKKDGGPTKNISVEVDITDYEMLPNGVMKINKFELVGITILGSRNGVKVEPGIENAELSVVDVMGKEYFAKQQGALRLAYEKLDESKKGGDLNMNNVQENETLQNFAEEEKHENECGAKLEEKPQCEEKCNCEEEPKCEDCGEEKCNCEEQCNNEEPKENCEENNHCEEEPKEQEKGEENDEDDDDEDDNEEDDEDLKCELENLRKENEELKCQLNECGAKLEESEKMCNELKSRCEAMSDYEENKEKLCNYEKKEFMAKASELINSADLDEDVSKKLFESCENNEFATIDELKVKVALAAFDNIKKSESFSMPVNTPVLNVNSETKTKKSKSSWDVLGEYTSKN